MLLAKLRKARPLPVQTVPTLCLPALLYPHT